MSLGQYVDQFHSPLMKDCKLADDISSMSISYCNEFEASRRSFVSHFGDLGASRVRF